MKTAISLPDETFDRATRRAAELGISRSEFFAHAALRYLHELDAESTTRQIDRALESVRGGPGTSDPSADDAVTAGRRLLEDSDDQW